ncbi:MAG: hypothetical protein Q4Q25_03475 [Methanocorpusculum sp.]|nr:hypothetical protein [Methanocorpusculum sp.]
MKKKFITTAPRQPVYLENIIEYEPVNCEYLRYKPCCYPILNVMNAYLQGGDTAELLILTARDQVSGSRADEYCEKNYELLSEQAAELAAEKGAQLKTKRIEISFSENVSTLLDNFLNFTNFFEVDETVYADISYGTKPALITLWMALNYAQKNVKGLEIEAFVYGLKVFVGRERKEIYDLTRLFLMDQVVSELSALQVEDPADVIKNLLSL